MNGWTIATTTRGSALVDAACVAVAVMLGGCSGSSGDPDLPAATERTPPASERRVGDEPDAEERDDVEAATANEPRADADDLVPPPGQVYRSEPDDPSPDIITSLDWVDAAALVAVRSDGRLQRWTDDGSRLAASSDQNAGYGWVEACGDEVLTRCRGWALCLHASSDLHRVRRVTCRGGAAIVDYAASADGRWIAGVCSMGGEETERTETCVWRAASGRRVRCLPVGINANYFPFAFDPQGDRLLAYHDSGWSELSAPRFRPTGTRVPAGCEPLGPRTIRWSADGRLFQWDQCSLYVFEGADLHESARHEVLGVLVDAASRPGGDEMAALYTGGLVLHEADGDVRATRGFSAPLGEVRWSDDGERVAVAVTTEQSSSVRVYSGVDLERVWSRTRRTFSPWNPIAWRPGRRALACLDESYRSIEVVELGADGRGGD